MAHALVQYNLERDNKDKLILVPHEAFAISVTPAIAIILYAMADINNNNNNYIINAGMESRERAGGTLYCSTMDACQYPYL